MTAAVVLIGMLIAALVIGWLARFGRSAIAASRRINADAAFLRAIPSGVER